MFWHYKGHHWPESTGQQWIWQTQEDLWRRIQNVHLYTQETVTEAQPAIHKNSGTVKRHNISRFTLLSKMVILCVTLKLSRCMMEISLAMAWHPILGAFPPHTQCSWDTQIHCNDEWINELIEIAQRLYHSNPGVPECESQHHVSNQRDDHSTQNPRDVLARFIHHETQHRGSWSWDDVHNAGIEREEKWPHWNTIVFYALLCILAKY